MAYGDKYYGSFKDYFDRTVLITVQERGYSGVSSEMKMAGGSIEYMGSDTNLYEPIISSMLTFNVVSETDFQYIDIYSADAKKFRVKVEIDSVMHWVGFIVPDLFNEPYVGAPYISSFVAVDGLKGLESETFDLSGVKSHYEILSGAFLMVDPSLTFSDFTESVNIYEENHDQTTADSPLTQTYVDTKRYEDLTWYEVIEDIIKLYGARLYQKSGQWWLSCVHEFKNESLITRAYTSEGTSEGTYNNELFIGYYQDNKPANRDHQLSILPGWKEFNINFNLGLKDSILKNADFDNWTITGYGEINAGLGITIPTIIVEPDDWDVVATNYFLGNGVDDKYIDLYGNQASPGTYYIQQILSDLKFTLGARTLKTVLNFRITSPSPGSAGLSQMWIMIRIYDGVSTSYYLGADGNWSTTLTYINIEDIQPVQTGGAFQDFVITSNGIPGGYLYFTVHLPDVSFLDVSSAHLTLLSPDGDQYPEQITYTKVINANNNYIADETELMTGDFPDVGNDDTSTPSDDVDNEKFVYYGGLFRDANRDNITKKWQTRDGIADTGFTNGNQLHKIVSRQKEFLSVPQWAINGTILSQYAAPDSCIVDYEVNNKKYLFTNGIFNLQSAQLTGTFIEVGNYSGSLWILADGTWNDSGIWVDSDVWNDGSGAGTNVIVVDVDASAGEGFYDITTETGITSGDTIDSLWGSPFQRDHLYEDETEIEAVPYSFTGTNLYLYVSRFHLTDWTVSFTATIGGETKTIILNVTV